MPGWTHKAGEVAAAIAQTQAGHYNVKLMGNINVMGCRIHDDYAALSG